MFGEPKLPSMKNRLLLLLLILLPLISFAQNEDLQLWGSVKFSKKVNSKIRFEFQEQIRWEDSLSLYKKNFTEFGFKYKIKKSHTLGTNVRYVSEFEKDKYIRMNVDLNSEYSPNRFPLTFKQRIRWQQSWDSTGLRDKTQFRSKWTLALKNKLIVPYLSHELFWKIATEKIMSKKRSTLGVSWSMMDRMKMKLFLRSQDQLNNDNPESIKVIGFGVYYKV